MAHSVAHHTHDQHCMVIKRSWSDGLDIPSVPMSRVLGMAKAKPSSLVKRPLGI